MTDFYDDDYDIDDDDYDDDDDDENADDTDDSGTGKVWEKISRPRYLSAQWPNDDTASMFNVQKSLCLPPCVASVGHHKTS